MQQQDQEGQNFIQIEEKRKPIEEDMDNPISLDGEELYNLPQKKKVQAKEMYSQVRKDLERNQTSDNNIQTTRKLIEDIDQVLESHLFTWGGASEHYLFKLPHTVFSGNEAPVSFSKPEIVYGTHVLRRLNREQLTSIKQHGEFVVTGSNEDQKTTWRLNSWIIRGKDYIRDCFYRGLGQAFHQLIQIKCRLGWKYARNYSLFSMVLNPNLFDGFISITSVASNLLNLVFGMRKVQVFNKEQIIAELLQERSQETIKLHHKDISIDFFEFIYRNDHALQDPNFNYELNGHIVTEISEYNYFFTNFRTAAQQLEETKLKEMEKQNLNEKEALMEIFNEKQELLFSMIRSGTYVKDKKVQEHLISLIQATQITKRYYHELGNQMSAKREEITQQVQTNHPIRSYANLWKFQRIKTLLKPIIANLVKECNGKIIKELNEKNLKIYSTLFERFVEFQQNEKTIYNQNYSRIQKLNTEPCRTFETFQYYMKPYRVKEEINSHGVRFYSFDTGVNYKTPTSFFGWRLVLQLLRWKVWTKNTFVTLVDNLCNGPLGLKALFKLTPFYRDQYVDYSTGHVTQTNKITPWLVCFMEAMRGIKRTVQDFEAQPDRGIFGKNFARIFKYLECVFRFLVSVGIIGVGMPVGIIINCVVSLVLAITSWAWIPVTLLIRSVFHLLFWDLDSPTRKGWAYYPYYYARYQTYQAFPLINSILKLVFGVLEIGTSVASATVLHPALSLISVVKSALRGIGQNISDAIMCKVTSAIGRQPEMDTFIAWKVRGTGVTRQYTYSMDVEDVKFLMRAHLERLELTEYEQRLSERISEPRRVFDQISKNIFRYYGVEQSSSSYIEEDIEKLMKSLRKQIHDRKKVFPKLPNCNIKFTEEELSNVFFQCESIVKTFVESRQMYWIFKKYDIENKDDFKVLTEKFLVQVFHDDSNILYPISELDKRIEIHTKKQHQFESVSRAIKGKTHLKTYTATIPQKFKKFLITSLFPFVDSVEVQNNSQSINENSQFNYTKYTDPSKVTYNFKIQDYKRIKDLLSQQHN